MSQPSIRPDRIVFVDGRDLPPGPKRFFEKGTLRRGKDDMTTGKRFLSAADAAKRLGVTQRNVVYHIRAGNLPAQQIGGVWILREDAVTRYLARRTGDRPGPKPRQATA
jgi:excisionase family DNA binding protein